MEQLNNKNEEDKSNAEYGDGEELILEIHSFKPTYLITLGWNIHPPKTMTNYISSGDKSRSQL